MRVALGVSYRGGGYNGWQSQPDGRTVQDALEKGLSAFAAQPIRTICAGRTDAGVHGINQVVHFDTEVDREPFSWVRGSNRYLPTCRSACAPRPSRWAASTWRASWPSTPSTSGCGPG